jgi:hypothetical protein
MTDFGVPPGTFPPSIPPPPPSGGRTGPPWEQTGPAIQRYIDTVKGVLLDPATTFRNMRREGGLGAPIVYYLIGGLISVIVSSVWQGLGLGMGMDSYGPMGAYAGGGLVAGIVFGCVLVVIGLFIGSGIVHLMLMLLGGAKFPFETTLRTIAYGQGSAAPLGIVPFCGGLIAGLWGLFVAIVGLSEMQEISIGRAAAAILIPVVVCCFLMMLTFGAALMAILGMAAANN